MDFLFRSYEPGAVRLVQVEKSPYSCPIHIKFDHAPERDDIMSLHSVWMINPESELGQAQASPSSSLCLNEPKTNKLMLEFLLGREIEKALGKIIPCNPPLTLSWC